MTLYKPNPKLDCKVCNIPRNENAGELILIAPEVAAFICDNCLKAIIEQGNNYN